MRIRVVRTAFVHGALLEPGREIEWPSASSLPPWAVAVAGEGEEVVVKESEQHEVPVPRSTTEPNKGMDWPQAPEADQDTAV